MNSKQFSNLKVGKKLVSVNNLNGGMRGVVSPMVESIGDELTVVSVDVSTSTPSVRCSGHKDGMHWNYLFGQVRFIRSNEKVTV